MKMTLHENAKIAHHPLFSADSGMIKYFDGDIPAKEAVTTTKRKCTKPMEQALSDPFPLPLNFRPDVELALKAGKMTTTTSMAQVAAAIFWLQEFLHIAMDITKKYPLQCNVDPRM